MITPRFRLEQSDKDVTIFIHAPYTDVNATDVHVDQEQVCFYSSPYYLRLHLPGPVIEDEESKGSFDADKGEFIIKLSKMQQGQNFEDLDMINALLNPAKSNNSIVNIEVLNSIITDGEASTVPSKTFEDFDWFIEQEVEALPVLTKDTPKYGFGNTTSGIFCKLESELPDLLDLQMPDSTPSSERAKLQKVAEDKSFSPEHYLADWAEEGQLISIIIHASLPWEIQEEDALTTGEQERLLKLPRRELLPLEITEQRSTMLGLTELIFCWAHEQRCSSGDPGPESARSVRRLSATFSWLREFHSAKQLVHSCVRRALCVPLYRNWNLAVKTLEDTRKILMKGRMRVLKVLLDLLEMFDRCESHHVLSQLYIEPYCIWLQQSVSDFSLASLAAAIEKATPNKNDLPWELDELETAGRLALEEESAQDLAAQISSKLHINERTDDSDDCSSSSDDSESSSGDYSCSSDTSDAGDAKPTTK